MCVYCVCVHDCVCECVHVYVWGYTKSRNEVERNGPNQCTNPRNELDKQRRIYRGVALISRFESLARVLLRLIAKLETNEAQ